ncbi:NmrA family NAD(P)-binding protein [Flavivirga eckloniae]|nr:NmrA family NAD(P)-binding protein [Flavivirga eckloniae]
MENIKILVTTANGHTGFPAAKELLDLGFKVKAMIRNINSPNAQELKRLGAKLFVGDMNDIHGVFISKPHLKKFEREQEIPFFLKGMKYVLENENWIQSHA